MAPTEPRNNPGIKTAAQAMVPPGQTEKQKFKYVKKKVGEYQTISGANEKAFRFLLVLL